MISVLLTGFGPFPGAPANPTGALALRLARLRHPALHEARLAAHVFRVSYAAVDRELPALIARHRPDVLLMFGLAARTRHVRIETRARNARAAFPDADGIALPRRAIVPGATHRMLPQPTPHILSASRGLRAPVRLSRDAGAYLCNYLCWRALDMTAQPDGPQLAAFIHVPKLDTVPRRRSRDASDRITMDDLARIGSRVLLALVVAARRRRCAPRPQAR